MKTIHFVDFCRRTDQLPQQQFEWYHDIYFYKLFYNLIVAMIQMKRNHISNENYIFVEKFLRN